MSYQHLAPQAAAPTGNRLSGSLLRLQRLSQSAQAQDEQESASVVVSRHTNAHWIASSREAQNNPILALSLIKRRIPHEDAIGTLQVSARHLSKFTKRKMIAVCAGWELLDTEDRNIEAFTYSTTHNDENGYWAGFKAAQRVLEKHVELWTEEDIRSLSERYGVATQSERGMAG
ncbi:hypothetical protein N4224_02140 [Yersinia enterocolitica]|uniref:hypothetical protein n=1 Tax=Yersinia enterocolitica TaxID=630 RepID=UPI0021E94510|nr:hypothetical protein [Yersinia enterocolitica]UYJ85543.1 hypothetical protein N4W04_02135 [Yersinia enterocolitica]UYK14925.1 hypothetical protein N4224_02140 [Yersinia enterocolitica]